MLLLLPRVIMVHWWDNKAMTAVEPLQRKGKTRPAPRLGQHPYLFPHLRHNPLNAIKTLQ